MIQGVIFDLDGTLLDTLPDIMAGVNSARRTLQLSDWPVEDIRRWIGEGLPILCQRALVDAPHIPAEQMVSLVSAYYEAHRLDHSRPYPGITELLDGLATRGIAMAVLSNKPHEHTLPMTQAMFGQWPWTAIEGYRQEDCRKPNPQTTLDIVQAMGLTPDRVAFVGDSETDMRTAVNAKVVPVGATWGYREKDVLIANGARILVDTPLQVLDLVASR